jgi:hypothetical protein
MPLFIRLIATGAGLGLTAFCIFCAVRPESVAARLRRRYERSSKLIEKWPFANLVMKPWYPTYLRVVGSFGFLTLIWLYALMAYPRGSTLLPAAVPASQSNTIMRDVSQIEEWKTFHNRAGWSINYPPDWRISSCHNCSDPTAADVFVSLFPPHENAYNDGTVMIEHLQDKPPTANTNDWLANVKRTANLNPIISEEMLSLNGYPALKVRYRTAPGAEMQEVYVVSGSSTFSITFNGSKPGAVTLENFDSYPIYLQMVGTFKISR